MRESRIFVEDDRNTLGRQTGGSCEARDDLVGPAHCVIEIVGLEDEASMGVGSYEKPTGLRIARRSKQENGTDLGNITVPSDWTVDRGFRIPKLRPVIRMRAKCGWVDRGECGCHEICTICDVTEYWYGVGCGQSRRPCIAIASPLRCRDSILEMETEGGASCSKAGAFC